MDVLIVIKWRYFMIEVYSDLRCNFVPRKYGLMQKRIFETSFRKLNLKKLE
jgi:hypothetical protein